MGKEERGLCFLHFCTTTRVYEGDRKKSLSAASRSMRKLRNSKWRPTFVGTFCVFLIGAPEMHYFVRLLFLF